MRVIDRLGYTIVGADKIIVLLITCRNILNYYYEFNINIVI